MTMILSWVTKKEEYCSSDKGQQALDCEIEIHQHRLNFNHPPDSITAAKIRQIVQQKLEADGSLEALARSAGIDSDQLRFSVEAKLIDISESQTPPVNAKFLYCLLVKNRKQRERILDALDEDFASIAESYGVRRARFFYCWSVARELVNSIGRAIKKCDVFSVITEIGKLIAASK